MLHILVTEENNKKHPSGFAVLLDGFSFAAKKQIFIMMLATNFQDHKQVRSHLFLHLQTSSFLSAPVRAVVE
jgi:hypothetical protein